MFRRRLCPDPLGEWVRAPDKGKLKTLEPLPHPGHRHTLLLRVDDRLVK